MKTFGLLATQTLVSLPFDDDGNAITDSLKPHDAGDDWTPPVVVPLVKIDKPTEPSGKVAEPKLVWFEDRVERQWDLVDLSPAALRETIEATFRTTVAAGHCITPEGWCLAMDDIDRANWSQLLVLLREAEGLGGITGESTVQFLDITGTPRQLTLTRFREVIVGLGQAYQAAFFTRAAALAALA
jgi:hypothetical protein